MCTGLRFNSQEGMKNQRESGKEKERESSYRSQIVLNGHTSIVFHLKHYFYWVIILAAAFMKIPGQSLWRTPLNLVYLIIPCHETKVTQLNA